MKRIIIALATVSMVFGFVGATLAADWNFYGSSRMATFWTNQDKNLTGANFDRNTLNWGLQGNSRIGATVKANDELSGGFEYGTGVNVRKLYGEYNFSGVNLLVGQTYTPINFFYSNQVFGGDNDLLDSGMPYDGRRPMIRISTQGFELAFVEPTTLSVDGFTDSTKKYDLPKIEAKYSVTVQNFTFEPFAGYQTYKVVNDLGTTKNEQSVDSWMAGLGIQSQFGPFYARGLGYVAQNQANFGMPYNWGPWDNKVVFAEYNPTGNSMENATDYGAGAVLGYTVNDMFSLEAGYGYLSGDIKTNGIKKTQSTQEYYFQVPITLAKNVVFTAEAGVMDGGTYKVTGVQDQKIGTESYVGGKWQINF